MRTLLCLLLLSPAFAQDEPAADEADGLEARLALRQLQIENAALRLELAIERLDQETTSVAAVRSAAATLLLLTAENDIVVELREELRCVRQELGRAQDELERTRELFDRLTFGERDTPPPLDGKVVFADNDVDPAVCSLSLGRRDGVRNGFVFTLWRDKTFVARVIVEETLEDVCHCRVLFTKEGEVVLVDDCATNR